MKSQPTVNFTHFGQLLFSILLILLLSLFVAGNTQACHKNKPHGKDAPETCGQTDVVGPVNDVVWGTDIQSGIFDHGSRTCRTSQIATDESSGTYSCVINTAINADRTIYNFGSMTSEPVHRRGDDWRCLSTISDSFKKVDLEYSYSWDGDCTSVEGCDVTIINRFNYPWTMGHSVARITVEAFAKASDSTANPFAELQSLDIAYLHLTMFAAKGNDKVLAVCKLTPDPVNYPVTFLTMPEP